MTDQNLILKLLGGSALTVDECKSFFLRVGRGECSFAEMCRILLLLNKRGISESELLGAASAFRQLAKALPGPKLALDPIDNCGTGGDGKDTFNISTAASLVIAACGVPVAKHGNRGVSSKCGSADILEALGINIAAPAAKMMNALKRVNFGYFHAPLYHPAMRNVAPFRKMVGTKTIFNMLGPLLNPLRVKKQVVGTFDSGILIPMARVLKRLGARRAILMHSNDGIDEVSVSGETQIVSLENSVIRRGVFHPRMLDLPTYPLSALRGGLLKERVKDMFPLFSGKGRPALREAVALNAAFGIMIGRDNRVLRECYLRALSVMRSGIVLDLIKTLRKITE